MSLLETRATIEVPPKEVLDEQFGVVLQKLALVPGTELPELRKQVGVVGEHGGEGVQVAPEHGAGEALVGMVQLVQVVRELGYGHPGLPTGLLPPLPP